MDQHELKEVAKFRQRIEAAAAKTIYEAAGVPEPGPDDKQMKVLWNFSDVMDLEEDEVAGRVELVLEDLTNRNFQTPSQERHNAVTSFLHVFPRFPPATDIFGRNIVRLMQAQVKVSHNEKTAKTFTANAILSFAFKKHRNRGMGRVPSTMFIIFGNSNPLRFPVVEHEFVDRFGNAGLKFTEAYPAITFNKTIIGPTIKLKSTTEDGTPKLRFMNVSASAAWSGKAGLHAKPDRMSRSIQLNTLSPEEIHLGDYYHHNFNSLAPHLFIRFLELPLHVQSLIWEFSFEPRVVEIQYEPRFKRIWSPAKWPAQSLACKESNRVMRRIYEISPFGDATAGRGLLFNFNIDVFFLTFEKRSAMHAFEQGNLPPMRAVGQLKVARKFLLSLPPAQLPRIRHLGLDLALWKNIEHGLHMLRRRRHRPGGQEKYILPMLTGLAGLRIIDNQNVGVWRINRRMAVANPSFENLVPQECSAEELGLNANATSFDIEELLLDRLGEFSEDNPPWWNGRGIMYMSMEPMRGPAAS